MKKLYHLLGTIDDNATKAFIELQKHQLALRSLQAELPPLTLGPVTKDEHVHSQHDYILNNKTPDHSIQTSMFTAQDSGEPNNLVTQRVRRCVAEWMELHRRPKSAERDKDIVNKTIVLAKFLPEPVKAQEFLTKFSSHLFGDNMLLTGMETIVRPDVACKECAEAT
ncbi:unnamed protein product, partial [Timema podura]|nr:unnamed protein product [Timema podura]